jgi:hypothetical protein
MMVNDRRSRYIDRKTASLDQTQYPQLEEMISPQDDLTMIHRSPIYTRGTSPATEWDDHCREQMANARAFISEVRHVQIEIIAERPRAVQLADWFQPGPYDELLPLLDRAEALIRDNMCSYAYRRTWERRWGETAQFWELVNLRRVGKRVCELVELLKECEAQAAQLGDYVETIRSELPVWCNTIVVCVQWLVERPS